MSHFVKSLRVGFLGCGAVLAIAASTQALAQDANEYSGVADIVVTAQKREQSLQDVPIAVTALSQDTLQTNRILSINDLTSIAPNFTVMRTPSGAGIATMAMRGLVSAGSVMGQDKSISVYLDGVSIGSAHGMIFDLPDMERLEVLRGPQGTLFGRNSTGGAISVTTRDPSGEFHARQEVTVGNRNQLRTVTRVELPAWGPFSASGSFFHSERDGDMKNLGAGTVWDRTVYGRGITKAPKTLGAENKEGMFVAVKFEPSDRFKTVYKFDRLKGKSSTDGTALGALEPVAGLGPDFGGLILGLYYDALANGHTSPITGKKRPKAVYNDFLAPNYQLASGHSLTSTFKVNDDITIKNILAFRKSHTIGYLQIDGLGGLKDIYGALGPLNSPFLGYASQPEQTAKQWSDELQVNYDSEFLTLTAGAIWYSIKQFEGTREGAGPSVPGFIDVPDYKFVPGGNIYNTLRGKSLAGYVQGEFHITPQLDVVAGFRVTNDKKKGVNRLGFADTDGNGIPDTDAGLAPYSYNDTRSNYSIGVNFKPNDDLLLYAKHATGFVAGGVTSTIAFKPEIVTSYEAGVKADLFDRRLRLNVAGFVARYDNVQSVGSGRNLNPPEIEKGTVIFGLGDLKTKGIEAEVTAVPVDGLTLSGSFGYTDYKLINRNAALLPNPAHPERYYLTYRTPYTANVSAQYETQPLFGEATLMARIDGNWRDKIREDGRHELDTPASFHPLQSSPAGWLVNTRLALRNVELAGAKLELAAWAKNLFDNDRSMFSLDVYYAYAMNFEPARTFGVDAIVQF